MLCCDTESGFSKSGEGVQRFGKVAFVLKCEGDGVFHE